MQFCAAVAKDARLLDELLRYGCDRLYPRLMWQDKMAILALVVQHQPEYRQKYMDKFAIDFILTDYLKVTNGFSVENLIELVAFYQAAAPTENTRFGRVELWSKCEAALSQAFAVRLGDHEET